MGNTSKTGLHYAVFSVDNIPDCLWSPWSDKHPKNLTTEFLGNLQPQYFEYQADINLNKLNYKKRRQMAAIALRTAYSQELEALFSLLCASIQASHCIPGWMLFCQNKQLDNLPGKINDSKPIDRMWQAPVSWENISSALFASLILPDEKKEKNIKSGSAKLWSKWSSDFVQGDFSREYNSLKPGFRVKPSGNFLAIRSTNSTQGIWLAKNEFGSGFYGYGFYGKSNDFQLTKITRGWGPDAMAWGVPLISMSITNIVSTLKAINRIPIPKVKFTYPFDFDPFSKPWIRTTSFGVDSFLSNINVPEDAISQFNSDELRK